jgi:hypothetical protein
MPYLVLTTEEMTAKAAATQDQSHLDMLGAALDSMESGGYALVAIEPAGDEGGGPAYVFHRPDAGQLLREER